VINPLKLNLLDGFHGLSFNFRRDVLILPDGHLNRAVPGDLRGCFEIPFQDHLGDGGMPEIIGPDPPGDAGFFFGGVERGADPFHRFVFPVDNIRMIIACILFLPGAKLLEKGRVDGNGSGHKPAFFSRPDQQCLAIPVHIMPGDMIQLCRARPQSGVIIDQLGGRIMASSRFGF